MRPLETSFSDIDNWWKTTQNYAAFFDNEWNFLHGISFF